MNLLYYGDNLDVLRRHVENESVDLVYLDPPFNSFGECLKGLCCPAFGCEMRGFSSSIRRSTGPSG